MRIVPHGSSPFWWGHLIGISHVDPLKWDLTLDGTTKVIATTPPRSTWALSFLR